MTRVRGWVPGFFGAAALLVTCITGAHAAGADDMKACAAVGSTAVRLACFDAAAKDVKGGDLAACARVSSDAVRLACFDAASGAAPAVRSAAAPAASPPPAAAPSRPTSDPEMARLEEQMRAREALMRARIQQLNQRAEAVEQRAAALDRRAASASGQSSSGEPADPVDAFGDKYLDKKEEEPKKVAEKKFGSPGDNYTDPLTAEKYGKDAEEEEDEEDDGKVNEITVEITKIEKDPVGKLKVWLANGQVWKQIDTTHARWHKDDKNVARIRRAWLGSFLMTINDTGGALRVRRLK